MPVKFFLNRLHALLLIAGIFTCNEASALDSGDTRPDCGLKTPQGTLTQLADLNNGRVLYVDFWASWCPPCAKSFPFMNRLQASYPEQAFKIVAVNLDENRAEAEAFLTRRPAHFDIMFDPGSECAQAFDVRAMPSSYIIDTNGQIKHVHLGFRKGEAETIEQIIQAMVETDSSKTDALMHMPADQHSHEEFNSSK